MSIPRPAAVPNTSRGALWHLGGLMLICADGAATDGTLAVVEGRARLGYRTPAHVHTREDETLYIIDGEMSYERGDEAGKAGPGEVVFLPRHVVHSFEVMSGHAYFLLMFTPAGFEEYFTQVSSPARADRIPATAERATVDAQLMTAAAARLGVTILNQPEPTDQEPIRDP
jgi:hypothetical protein